MFILCPLLTHSLGDLTKNETMPRQSLNRLEKKNRPALFFPLNMPFYLLVDSFPLLQRVWSQEARRSCKLLHIVDEKTTLWEGEKWHRLPPQVSAFVFNLSASPCFRMQGPLLPYHSPLRITGIHHTHFTLWD